MKDHLRFLSSFYKVFQKGTGDGKLEYSEGNEKRSRIRNPAALPEEISYKFSLALVKAATNNFDQDLIIGSGGFGHVYKGFLNDWNLVIAVKRLYPDSAQGFNEFQAELLLLCQLHHQHVVPLIGFCNEKAEMILVYEYMENGALRDLLYDSGCDPLPRKQRLEICIGAARGLRYLHTGAKQAIIHRDVKSSNILLDDKLVCKLSDFGLAKLRPQSNCKQKTLTRIDSMVKSTCGYADPEYVAGFGLTEKSDVYSFGVVLFEVLCSRKAFDMSLKANQAYLVHWARRSIGEGTIYNIIDPNLKGRIATGCFKTFVDIACSCTCPEGNSRLEMGEVEVMLERALELQQKADSDMVRLASCGVYMFEEVSCCALVPEYSSGEWSRQLVLLLFFCVFGSLRCWCSSLIFITIDRVSIRLTATKII